MRTKSNFNDKLFNNSTVVKTALKENLDNILCYGSLLLSGTKKQANDIIQRVV